MNEEAKYLLTLISFISIVFAQNTKILCLDKKERQEYFNVEHNQHFS